MIKIIYLILCLILGILLYQILKNICECNIEGFGLFGRAKLGKCCPMDYMYSDTDKKCVKICDGCAMGAYSPLTLKQEQYYGDSQPQLHAIFDCKENDSSEVYNYEKINRLYKKSDLMDQYDFGFNLDSEMMMSGSGVQAAEEGGNEAWAGISTDASTAQLSSDTVDVSTEQQHYFEEIPEELYYTIKDGCYEDYEKFSQSNKGGNPPASGPFAGKDPPNAEGLYDGMTKTLKEEADCRGYWKLDMVDQRYDYLKDGDRSIAVPSWRVYTAESGSADHPGYNKSIENVPDSPPFEDYKLQNLPFVEKYLGKNGNSILNSDSPVYKYYQEKFKKFKCGNPEVSGYGHNEPSGACTGYEPEQVSVDIGPDLLVNRNLFCSKLKIHIQGQEYLLRQQDTDIAEPIMSGPRFKQFLDAKQENYNTLCGDEDSIDPNSTNKWNNFCMQTPTQAWKNVNSEWIRETDPPTNNILCDFQEEKYLCADGSTPDPSKNFCS